MSGGIISAIQALYSFSERGNGMLRYVAIEIDGKDEHAVCRFRGTWATIEGFVREMVSRQSRGRMNMAMSLYEVIRPDTSFATSLFFDKERPLFTLLRLKQEFLEKGDLREVTYQELHEGFPVVFPLPKQLSEEQRLLLFEQDLEKE